MEIQADLNTQNIKTQNAYKLYSRFYAAISLLAYWIVWRGNIFRHIEFFREIKKYGLTILDIATGDGSLTQISLFKGKGPLPLVTCLDISEEMLQKARRKLPSNLVEFKHADVMNLPYANNSQKIISCFGGLNSFPSGALALKEIHRVLKEEGIVRGSVLLLPKTPWRQNLIYKWIVDGYQSEIVTEKKFLDWVHAADFKPSAIEKHGDVLLFELRKRT